MHHLAPGGIDTDALLIIDWTPVKEGGGISQTQPVWMLCEGKVLFSDVLVLAGTTVFKRSERRGGRTSEAQASCGFGPLAQTCDTSVCCDLLEDHRNIF